MTGFSKAAVAFGLFCGLCLLGCERQNSPSRFIPRSQTAKKAIESALETWKNGTAYGPIAGQPSINVFDARWQFGAKLISYEILDQVQGEGQPTFQVKLQVEGSEPEVDNYLVVGIDPLLVFRDVDYRKTSGM